MRIPTWLYKLKVLYRYWNRGDARIPDVADKDRRLEYSFRYFQALKDVCLVVGFFYISGLAGIVSLFLHASRAIESVFYSFIGYSTCAFALVVFGPVWWWTIRWISTDEKLFKQAGLREPPMRVLSVLSGIFAVSALAFGYAFHRSVPRPKVPPPPMPRSIPAPVWGDRCGCILDGHTIILSSRGPRQD